MHGEREKLVRYAEEQDRAGQREVDLAEINRADGCYIGQRLNGVGRFR